MSGRPVKSLGIRNGASPIAAPFKGLMVVFALLALLVSSSALHAQVLYGSLTGTVTDQTGAVVPNVTITITNQGTNDVRTVKANGQGDYTQQNLLPGVYTIAIAPTANFAGYTQKNVRIDVNHEVRIDVALQPAGVTAEVEVTSAPPQLQTETAEVNHEISETQLDQLPVTSTQGRNFQSLYTILPGASNVAEQNSSASNPSRAMSVNVNGVEDMSNTTRIDGAVNYYGWLPYLIAYVPPADSIESVNVTTNSFNAEQGVAGGASISITIKSGTKDFHGNVWEYYQDAVSNARSYTSTVQSLPQLPKNVFNQYGFNVGGPVFIPHVITGKKKLFFFQNFERTTRRQMLNGTVSVPDVAMLGGNFNEAASAGLGLIYDPVPNRAGAVYTAPAGCPAAAAQQTVGGFLVPACRNTFAQEFPGVGNAIPSQFISKPAAKMLSYLTAVSQAMQSQQGGTISSALVTSQFQNDYNNSAPLSYNRITTDTKITYIPTEQTQVFGRYSAEPFNINDPQNLGAAGGGTFDGGQPGLAHGRIQNIGLGASHILTPTMVIDADFGYSRQVSGAQSTIDIADGDFGLNVLGIPGTNAGGLYGQTYVGQPEFAFGNITSTGTSNSFNSLGNANGANPFLYRDNQFTGDVNLSWTKGKHATKYGITYYHFDLNHAQPSSGGAINNPHGGFDFQGGMTVGANGSGAANTINSYNSLADFLLGMPNYGTSTAVASATELTVPNTMRWTEFAAYAEDQWTATPKLTVNYGVRYEIYPAPYRDHMGVFILNPSLPQSANVEIGGLGYNPQNAGLNMGWGSFVPRLGLSYRYNDKTVVRAGGGLTSDPDSLRFLRDSFPEDNIPNYTGTQANSIAMNAGQPMLLDATNAPAGVTPYIGIPNPTFPNLNSGFVSLPVTGTTNTVPQKYRRGYIESWNMFVQRDLGWSFVANVGYVGTHQVRQLTGVTLNAAPLPSSSTNCGPSGTYNAGSGQTPGTPCNFAANELVNTLANCPGTACYNTGGITMNQPIFSSNYNGLQTQLTRNAGKQASLGIIYTWSHGFDYEDNGAGSGSAGLSDAYPAYYKLNRATAGYDRSNNLQIWGIYHLPFGRNQMFASQGIASAILGGFQLNGQLSHVSGAPFSVSPSSTSGFNAPGNTLYAQLVAPYHQIGGHNRVVGSTAVSSGKAWFDPTSFANPVESATAPTFSNTHRDEFRGPGQTLLNASMFRSFHLYRESEFQARIEGFNVLNHALLNNPNTTVGSGTFGYITSFGSARTLQFSGRFTF